MLTEIWLTSVIDHLFLLAFVLVFVIHVARTWIALLRPLWRFYHRYLAVVFAILSLCVFGFGWWGYYSTEPKAEASESSACQESGHVQHTFDYEIYQAMQFFTLNAPPPNPDHICLQLARDAAMLLFLLVGIEFVERVFRDALTSLNLLFAGRGHRLVCGLGAIGFPLVRESVKQGGLTVVIEKDPQNKMIEAARRAGAIVICGDATDDDLLERVSAQKAEQIFVCTGNNTNNLEVYTDVRRLWKESGQVPKCYVHMSNPDLVRSLKSISMDGVGPKLEVFDARERSLRTLMLDFAQHDIPRISEHANSSPVKQIHHFILIGFGDIGEALILRLAEQAHFANLQRSRITVIADQDGRSRWNRFLSRHPRFAPVFPMSDGWAFDDRGDSWPDASNPAHANRLYRPSKDLQIANPNAVEYVCNAQFCDAPADIVDTQFLKRLSEIRRDGVAPYVFICGDDGHENFAAATRLRDRLLMGEQSMKVYVALPSQLEIANVLQERLKLDGRATGLIPFGACTSAVTLTEITQPLDLEIAAWLNAAYHRPPVTIPATPDALSAARTVIQGIWAKLELHFRVSNIAAATHGLMMLGQLGYAVAPGDKQKLSPQRIPVLNRGSAEMELLAKCEHNRWMAERLMSGWKYGPEKDNIRRQRPTMVPWEALTDAEKDLDYQQIETLVVVVNRLADLGEVTIQKLPEQAASPAG